MENQIYRIRMSDNKKLEFYICETNTVNPIREIKEIGIVLIDKEAQIDGGLGVQELSSLIKFLEDCKEYIEGYNSLNKK